MNALSDNFVSIQGNLTGDPELRVNQNSGKAMATFTVAINGRKNADGTEPEATFVSVTVLGDESARNFAASARKGMRVTVTGEIGSYKKSFRVVDDQGAVTVKNLSFITVTAWEAGVSTRWGQATFTKVARDQAPQGYAQPQAPQGYAQPQAPQFQPAAQGQGSNDF